MESIRLCRLLFLLMFSSWCPWPESNQHSLRNSILSRARLPVPPQGHSPHQPGGLASRSGRNIAGGVAGSTRAVLIRTRLDSGGFRGYHLGIAGALAVTLATAN